MADMTYPEDLKYTTDHEWLKSSGEGTYRVGITAFAQDALGDVVFVTPPAVGEDVNAGDSCGEVESTKSVSDLYAPVSGQVTAVNDALESSPDLINTDPYGQGWIYELKAGDPAEADGLLDAAAYQAQLS